MTRAEWRAVLLRDPCVYCGEKSKTLDHIQPQHFGGSDGWPNLAPCCKRCNQMKSDGSLIWMLWRRQERALGRYRERVIGFRWQRGVRVPITLAKEYQGRLRIPGDADREAREAARLLRGEENS